MNDSSSSGSSFLGHDRIFPLLLKMGLPAAVGMLVNALYNIVDTIFVGLGVGKLAIAALTIVFPLQMLVSAFAQAIGFGASSIVSRRLGEKRPETAAKTIGTAYTAVALCTAVVIALVYLFMRPILTLFGATEAIMPYAVEYLSIIAAGFFFFSLSMAANSLIRAEGNARASMVSMLIGAILNCILCPLFIFGFGWGVRGSAIATVISQAVSCAYVLTVYLSKKNHIDLHRRDFLIDRKLLAESSLLGVPAFVQEIGMSALAIVVNNSLRLYGGDTAITEYGMVNRFMTLIVLPMIGIIQGFQPIAGFNFGARHFDRVRRSVRITAVTAVGFTCFGYIFTMGIPGFCMGLFTTDAALRVSSAAVLRINTLLLPLVAVQIVGTTYFQAVGKPIHSLFLGLSRQFIILIPLLLVLPLCFGLSGIWWSFPLSDLLSSGITMTLLARELRRLGD